MPVGQKGVGAWHTPTAHTRQTLILIRALLLLPLALHKVFTHQNELGLLVP